MKNINLLFVLMLLISAAGCKKEDDDKDNTPGGTPKLKTYQVITPGDTTTYNYVYLSDGRLESEISSNGGGALYSYNDTAIVMLGLAGDTLMTYKLNANGYVASGMGPGITFTYGYNAQNNRVDDGGATSTWVDGNRASSNSGVTIFTYYTDKKNTLGNENKGQLYFGVDSKNLVHTVRTAGNLTATYLYTLDSNDRVTQRTSDNIKELFTYY